MKKLLTILVTAILAVTCVFGLTACGEQTVKVGTQQGTTGFMYSSCLKGVETKAYTTAGLATQDLKNGVIDYVIVDGATAKSLCNEVEGLKIVDIPLTTEQYAIGVDKAQANLLTAVNGVLESKQAEISAIIEKYLAGNESQYVPITSAVKDSAKAATQLVVATNAAFAPFEMFAGDKFVGIDMEIANLIATELSMELVIEHMEFEAVVSSIGKNSVDLAMAALTITAERKTSINFSSAYYQESQVVVTLASNTALDGCGTVIDVLNVLTANK